MYEFIYLIKTLAAILICNSHMGELYPISVMAVGGSLGNSLFFIVSGFLISTKTEMGPVRWYLKRCSRLYPPYWILNLVLLVAGSYDIFTIQEFFYRFILPVKSFWFVGAILIFYALFYFVIRSGKHNLRYWILVTTIIYFIGYVLYLDLSRWTVEGSGYFKFIFYFDVMLCGYWIKVNFAKVKGFAEKHRVGCMTGGVISVVVFLGIRLAMIAMPIITYIQFLAQASSLLFAGFAFMTALSFESSLKQQKDSIIGKTLIFIGSSTLEIYLVNYVLIDAATQFVFPVNLILAFSMIFATGVTAHYSINAGMNLITARLRRR